MNQRLLLFSFLLFHCFAYAQTSKPAMGKRSVVSKPAIDTTAIFNWPSLQNHCSISPNGNYIRYKIFNQPRGKNTLVIQSTSDTAWKKQMVDATAVCFSADEKQAVYSNRDSLFFLSLDGGQVMRITGVQSYRQPGIEGTWLAYQLKGDTKDVVLLNMVTGQEQRFSSVDDYSFSENGKTLLVKQNDHATTSLQWINLETKKASIIWTAQNNMQVSSYNFDQRGEQLVFMVKAGLGNTVWYYKEGMNTAIEKVDEKTEGIASGLQIAGDAPFFNKSAKYIFFKLEKPIELPKSDPDAVAVDVWNYKDVILQSEQPKIQMPELFTSVIAADSNRVVQVEQEDEKIATSSEQNISNHISSDYLVTKKKGKLTFWWNDKISIQYKLISVKDATVRLIRNDWTHEFIYSPNGKFIIYFNSKQKHYISYEIETSVSRNITKTISEKLEDENKLYVPGRTYPLPVGIGGWFDNDESVLIYDNYDIWKVDLAGNTPPINITNGYGKKHRIKLKLAYEKDPNFKEIIRHSNELLLLTAFNLDNKHNGFYQIRPDKKGDPQQLFIGPFLFYRLGSQVLNSGDAFNNGMQPIKALNKNVWLVKRQSATEAPNYFLTNDFRFYKPLTNIQPHQNYNWVSTKLMTFKQLDGTISQGVLYRPENFDSTKKYPVIFSYYETFSFRLNEFPNSGLARARIDIPWYVGRGYLVFTPDINYSIASVSGKVAGDHAMNSVVGAANYLSKLPYVDARRMGIQGHSFAGGETNYLITHTNIFAAACEASGGANVIKSYLSLLSSKGVLKGDKQLTTEIGQGRMGANLWQRPDLYFKASSVLYADKVKTPLLIMHNQGDGAVDWTGSIEMYMALRRLQKPVWMLQYDDEGHQIGDDRKAVDFTIRMNQFFDHYLKGELPPSWMIANMPRHLKGIKSFLQLSEKAICYKKCSICTNIAGKEKIVSKK